jgi:hypothetical protein
LRNSISLCSTVIPAYWRAIRDLIAYGHLR